MGKFILITIFALLLHLVITYILFMHRVENIQTHYGLRGVDTDGTLWHQVIGLYSQYSKINFEYTNKLLAFPYGMSLAKIPIFSLVYEINKYFIDLVHNKDISFILVTNVSTILAHPFTGFACFLLGVYLFKNYYAALIFSVAFTYSYFYTLMSAGSLSLDHYQYIPIYFLSLFFTLNNPHFYRILLSALCFSLLFMANPYWAFYSGLCSIFVLLGISKERMSDKIRICIRYYLVLFIFLGLTNISYIRDQFYNFNSSHLIVSGKGESPEEKLLPVHNFFAPAKFSSIFSFGHENDYSLTYTLCIGFIILALLRKKPLTSIQKTSIFIVLLSILITSRIPNLYFINRWYFDLFGMFRSVSRINIFATFFLGMAFASLLTDYFNEKKNTIKSKTVFVAISLLIFFITLEGLNNSPDFASKTDFTKISKFYSHISNNPRIHYLATYPMLLSDGKTGFPSRFDLLGQIIHKKPLANGSDPFDEVTVTYSQSIGDISHPTTINTLREHYVDTIVIYNHLYGSDEVSQRLKKDSRLSYVGTYHSGQITNQKSDKPWSMSIFSIRNAIPYPDFNQLNSGLIIEKQSSTKYTVKSLTSGPKTIYLDEPARADWRIYRDSKLIKIKPDSHDKLFLSWQIYMDKKDVYYVYYFPGILNEYSQLVRYIVFLFAFYYVAYGGIHDFVTQQFQKRKNLLQKSD